MLLLLKLIVGRWITYIDRGHDQPDWYQMQYHYEPYFMYNNWDENFNLIPFKNILYYIIHHDRFNLNIILDNTVMHVVAFVPIGMILPPIIRQMKQIKKFLILLIVMSFMIEIAQFVLRVGQFDIDAIILNTLGALVGFVFVQWASRKKKLINKYFPVR